VKQSENTGAGAKGPGVLSYFEPKTRVMIGIALVATIAAGAIDILAIGSKGILLFVVSAAALAVLAALIGEGTDQLGSHLGPGATGVLQSALGNLPELFVAVFALRAGLIEVVQAALIGSILGNSLLVLGLAILVGGLRHGTQKFTAEVPRMVATLTLLAVAALAVPTLAAKLHTPAASYVEQLSIACAVVVLVVFIASIPVALKGGPITIPSQASGDSVVWPLWLAVTVLVAAGIGAGLVSEWFVSALEPAMTTLHLSQAFTGLVVVALAGNAVEHSVGVQLAARNKMDFAISVILNSSLQVALALIPFLVLLSLFLGGASLTLVLPPLMVVAVGLTVLLSTVITYDGESTWLEGAALIGLYCVIAVSFWWG
jgi:Ca2+:H+ antiporter